MRQGGEAERMIYVLHTKSGKPFESLTVPLEVGKDIISWMERGEMKYLDFNLPWTDGTGYDRYILPIEEVAGITVKVTTHIAHAAP
jgi:hypothetical protein